ncbi:hypothetical protein FACS189454_09420 [Planctomycetales bacterium]|nr:hypothetical protein FACS189454_09420 [Planctomycetales bacterium]
MLLIDDVHFFSGKVATQNEFLHVMDDCIQHGVQIVLSGNRKPDDLDLHNNVVARIASGIACGIGLPEPELALQLCRNTAIERRMDLSDEVCRMIADRFGASARLIQGALNRLYAATLCKQTLCTQPEQISGSAGGSASSTFASATLTLPFAEELLSDLPSMKRAALVTLKDVEKAVCEVFNIHREVLQSKNRTKNVTRPRMIAMYLARKFTQSALSEIGAFFGKMSHSSVISSQQRVERWIETNDKIVPVLRSIEKRLT